MLTEGWQAPSEAKLWNVVGEWLRDFDVQTLVGAMVTADFRDVAHNALFLSSVGHLAEKFRSFSPSWTWRSTSSSSPRFNPNWPSTARAWWNCSRSSAGT